MEEQLLHFIWHRKLFNQANLVTTTNEAVAIILPGIPNQDQGPDFLQSRIRIGEQLWAGHVEIHIRSSAWFQHMHERDAHYNNVILHVVWEEDQPALTLDGQRIPCLELAGRVESSLLDRYRHLMKNEEWIPCADALMEVPEIIRISWLERLMAERLEQKSTTIIRILEKCAFNWEQAFYLMLARQLGAPANGEAMEELASRIPLSLLRRHADRPDQLEALLFGGAGMLGKELHHPYVSQLKKEFDFLRRKYNLRPMPALQWRFMRMRPAHFPTIRIAQLAAMAGKRTFYISLLEEQARANDWMNVFSVVPHHTFWNDHYHFSETSRPAIKRLGRNTVAALVINVVAPVMFVYGKHQGKAAMKAHALRLLEELPAEKNSVISGWKGCGWMAEDAGQTQALLFLKKNYCDQRKCLHCAIGMQVIK